MGIFNFKRKNKNGGTDVGEVVFDYSFLMVVEDVFSISGRGSVITGKITEGRININDRVAVSGKCYTVGGIESNRELVKSAEANMNVGILLKDAEPRDIQQGETVRKVLS